jgi:hypothetical protein
MMRGCALSPVSNGGILRSCPSGDFADFEMAGGIGTRTGVSALHDLTRGSLRTGYDDAALESHPFGFAQGRLLRTERARMGHPTARCKASPSESPDRLRLAQGRQKLSRRFS